MPKKKSSSVLREYTNLTVQSFKKIKELFLVFLIDCVYFGLVYIFLMQVLESFKRLTFNTLGGGPESITDSSIITSYIRSISVMGFLFLVIIFVLYTFSRALIWKVLTDKKFDKKYFIEFFKYNFLWLLFWIVPLITLFFGITSQFKLTALSYTFVVFAHFSGALHYSIAEGKKVMQTFAKLSVEKFYYLIPVYAFVFITGTVLFKLLEILPYSAYTTIVLLVLIMSLLRVNLSLIFEWLK